MSYLTKITSDGVYRIKVLDKDSYVKYIHDGSADPWLQLTALDTSAEQKWKISAVSGLTNVYTIVSVVENAGLSYKRTKETYWGYGFPQPKANTSSQKWKIQEQTISGTTFAKIRLDGDDQTYFDSNDTKSTKNAVNFYYDNNNSKSGANQRYVFEQVPDEPSPSGAALDIVFILDITGSQQAFINKARDEIQKILNAIVKSGKVAPGKLRVAVVIFRDHPPQDTFLTDQLAFTTDFDAVKQYLGKQTATAGGDGPEAQCCALNDALELLLTSDDTTTKAAILITDSPPHGLGESGDKLPDGCPLQNDPLTTADSMARNGITLHVVACEPELSRYQKALDFYTGLTAKTGGQVLPLGDVDDLTNLIITSLTEVASVASRVATSRSLVDYNASFDDASQKLYRQLVSSNVEVDTLVIDDYYQDIPQARKNADLWANAKKLSDVRDKIEPVAGIRINDKYLAGGQPQAVTKKQPVNLTQARQITRACFSAHKKSI